MPGEPRHIIVIGAARSGTKFLRDLIAQSRDCAAVPYDINYVWRTGNEGLPHDRLTPDHLTPRRAKQVRRSLCRLSRFGRTPGARFIVEKTVSNCLRVPFVDAVLPEALYVNLSRDGRDVVESSCRQWHAPADRGYLLKKLRYVPLSNYRYLAWYAANLVKGKLSGRSGVGVWGVRYPGIDAHLERLTVAEVCAHQWVESVEQSRTDLAAIPEQRRIDIRHEDLVRDEAEVRRLAAFLGLPDADALVTNYQSKRRVIPPGAWADRFDAETWSKVLAIIGPTLEALGYDTQP